ncbi:MAG: hypothetical protein M1821_007397 [Bathelium mastoideum]|nr:MAG: hypothetical protein M1821_007397 [Bathelium mastoideum]
MFFTKPLIAVLASAALMPPVSAAVVNSTNATTSAGNLLSTVKAPPAAWRQVNEYCRKSRSKRDLEIRVDSPPRDPEDFAYVDIGEMKGGRNKTNLWTWGLCTCFGVAVTGTQADPTKDSRFMAHVRPDADTFDEEWTRFHTAVEDAHLENMDGWISTPDLVHEVSPELDREGKRLLVRFSLIIYTLLRGLVGKAPKSVEHPMLRVLQLELPYGTMQVNEHNEVKIDGTWVTQ